MISECGVKNDGKKDVHGCSNIADLNTRVSLHSSPVLMETARYFGGDFAICSKHFRSALLQLGVQCRFLDINGNSSQGRFPKCGKILKKKKQFREIR